MLYFTLLYFAELTCCGSGAAPLERVRAEFAPKTLLYSRFTIRAAAAAARSSGSGAAPLQRVRAEEGGGASACAADICVEGLQEQGEPEEDPDAALQVFSLLALLVQTYKY